MEDTECIVAKAIRDGGVDAVLDHANGWMLSKDVADIYATAEPAAAFHARVAFCLDIHNEVCIYFPCSLVSAVWQAWYCSAMSRVGNALPKGSVMPVLLQLRCAAIGAVLANGILGPCIPMKSAVCIPAFLWIQSESLLRGSEWLLLQAVRAMRFDAAANSKKLETAESARERVIAEEELAKAYEEEEGI